MADLLVRDLVADDQDAALDVRTRSFGPIGSHDTWWRELFMKNLAARRSLGVFSGEHLVATARIHAYR